MPVTYPTHLAGAILLAGGDARAAEALRAVTIGNPAHDAWEARATRVRLPGPEPPETLTAGGYVPDGPWEGWTWVPRFAPVDVANAEDRTVCPPAPGVSATSIELRPLQRAACRAWWDAGQTGQIVAPCGAGKTIMGLALVASCPTPALVLVHTLDLLRQWVDRARELLPGVEVSTIGGGKVGRPARLTVATLQTLGRWTWREREEFGARFGLVIADECHHTPALGICECLAALPGRYRLGLTATPTRHDGLTDLITWSCGPIRYQLSQADMEATGATLAPTIRWVATGYAAIDTAHSARRMTALVEDGDRNAIMVALARGVVRSGRSVLVLSERVEHCRTLAEAIARDGTTCESLVGEVTAARRADLLGRLRSGALQAVTATTIADEGLDVPSLDAVILATPTGNVQRVQQRVGRALRSSPGKEQPEVIDLVDDWGPWGGYAWRRYHLYRRLGWRPTQPPVRRAP